VTTRVLTLLAGPLSRTSAISTDAVLHIDRGEPENNVADKMPIAIIASVRLR